MDNIDTQEMIAAMQSAEEVRYWAKYEADEAAPSRDTTDKWQPIETAPKDGTLIFVHFRYKGVRAVFWESPFYDEVDGSNGVWCVDADKYGPRALSGYTVAATHWMPLSSEQPRP